MPQRALLDGEVVFPFDVERSGKKVKNNEIRHIIDDSPMEVVKQHSRVNGAVVPRHFRRKRGYGGEGGSTVGFSAGGGEKPIHRSRKGIALSVALEHFKTDQEDVKVTEYGIEGANAHPTKYVNGKRPDGYLEFDQGHFRYGKGIAIEYQHKNEQKDIQGTAKQYREAKYSTIWLWGDQFDESGNLPTVNLFDGRVDQVWPYPVPDQSQWCGNGFKKLQQDWREGWQNGLSESGAPATLPPDWCDDKAREIWESQDWEQLFSPPDEHTDIWCYAKVPASMPPEWHDEKALSIWNQQDWKSIFPNAWSDDSTQYTADYESDVYVNEVKDDLNDPVVEINWWGIFPESHIRNWYDRGLRSLEETKEYLPRPDSWSGTYQVEKIPEDAFMKIKLPPEFFEEKHELFRLHWEYGAGQLDLDLVHRLKENNAPRNCSSSRVCRCSKHNLHTPLY